MTPTVVVPLDGSDNAEQALPYAIALARRTGARLLLVSVVDVPVEMGAWTSGNATALGHELDAWADSTAAYLRRVAASVDGVPVTWLVRIGSAAREICAAVRELERPLIVMSSHGRTGAGRIFMGSVAIRLVHDAHCPVLVTRYQPDTPVVTPTFDTVVVPLDGSELAERALDEVAAVLGRAARLHLVRVITLPVIPAGAMYEPGLPGDYGLVSEYLEAARDDAIAYLATIAERLVAAGYRVTSEARDGRIADEILRAAEEQRADLIGMGTHGRGGLGRVVFGSIAEGVLHESRLPLLLVHPARARTVRAMPTEATVTG